MKKILKKILIIFLIYHIHSSNSGSFGKRWFSMFHFWKFESGTINSLK